MRRIETLSGAYHSVKEELPNGKVKALCGLTLTGTLGHCEPRLISCRLCKRIMARSN